MSWEHLQGEGGDRATPQSEAEKLYSFLCCAEMEAGAELEKDVVMVLGSVKWMLLSPQGFLCHRNGRRWDDVILQFGKRWKVGKRQKIDYVNELRKPDRKSCFCQSENVCFDTFTTFHFWFRSVFTHKTSL